MYTASSDHSCAFGTMSNFEKRNLRSGHLMWPGGVTFGVIGSSFFGNMSNCWLNSYGIFGAATRRRFLAICEKLEGGGRITNLGRARVNPRPNGGSKPPCGFSQIAPEVLGISLWSLPYLSGQQLHTLCQKNKSQLIIGQPEWRQSDVMFRRFWTTKRVDKKRHQGRSF